MSKNKNKQPQKPMAPKPVEAPKVQAPAPKEMQKFQSVPAKEHKPSKNTNPMAIKWPTDPWGFTRELRTAVANTARRLAGDAEKKKMLDRTMLLAVDFIEAKYAEDQAKRVRTGEKIRAKEEAKANPSAPKTVAKAPTPVQEPVVQEPELELDPVEDLAGDELEDALFGDESEMEESELEVEPANEDEAE